MSLLKVIMIGDVIGEPGLLTLESRLPALIKEQNADFVMVNGENAANGFGITEGDLRRILAAGADVVSSGNHVWEKREFWPFLEAEDRVLRPANYPQGSPGRGWAAVEKTGPSGEPVRWLAVNLQGREYMTPIDCPFKAFDAIVASETAAGPEGAPPFIVVVDFHAESSREKEALAFYLDGRAAVAAGTHTHVQTADERILPGGTAYITDLGMTGVTDSVIGMDRKICLDRARNQVLYRMEVAVRGENGKTAIQGIIAEVDRAAGKAVSIRRINEGLTELHN
jgi:metallophosphoesterase (TIGR00282 family)